MESQLLIIKSKIDTLFMYGKTVLSPWLSQAMMTFTFQRHVIRMVPVTQCFCEHKGKTLSYFVYGLESKVYSPEYPDQCCWGCTIL